MRSRIFISKSKRIAAAAVTAAMVLNLLPSGLISMFGELFNTKVKADNDSLQVAVHADPGDIPEFDGEARLYKGVRALTELPKEPTYKSDVDKPSHISVTEFRQTYGYGNGFNAGTFSINDTSLMIGTPTDLLYFSQGANSENGDEKDFYLSANVLLGANIEWSTMASGSCIEPIGSYGSSGGSAVSHKPFTGKFDGQGFEIRDLTIYTDGNYTGAYCALFGHVGSGAQISDFGLYHPSVKADSTGIYVSVIAGNNEGDIRSVYAMSMRLMLIQISPQTAQ